VPLYVPGAHGEQAVAPASKWIEAEKNPKVICEYTYIKSAGGRKAEVRLSLSAGYQAIDTIANRYSSMVRDQPGARLSFYLCAYTGPSQLIFFRHRFSLFHHRRFATIFSSMEDSRIKENRIVKLHYRF
jgi:hypothetical protein